MHLSACPLCAVCCRREPQVMLFFISRQIVLISFMDGSSLAVLLNTATLAHSDASGGAAHSIKIRFNTLGRWQKKGHDRSIAVSRSIQTSGAFGGFSVLVAECPTTDVCQIQLEPGA